MSFESPSGEIIVNSTRDGVQRYGDVAALEAGGHVVVWQDGANTIRAQRIDAEGHTFGPEILVNSPADGDTQTLPTVAALEDGGFVIVWADNARGIFAQRYDIAGQPAGNAVQISAVQQFYENEPRVTAIEGGGYAVVWGRTDDPFSASAPAEIVLRRIDAGGRASAEIVISTDGAPRAFQGTTAGVPGGGQIVLWQAEGGDAPVFAQLIGSRGARVGNPFIIATPAERVNGLAVTALDGGGFVAVWAEGSGIVAQLLDDAGRKIGGEIAVQAAAGDFLSNPDVAALPDGGFAISWREFDYGTFDGTARVRAFDADGTAAGEPVALNGVSAGDQSQVRIAVGQDGRLFAIWTDQNGAAVDIEGRVFDPVGSLSNVLPSSRPGLAGDASPQVLVNVEDYARTLRMTALDGGGFLGGWTVQSSDTEQVVRVQVFDNLGQPAGPVIDLYNMPEDAIAGLRLTELPGGGFAVAWDQVILTDALIYESRGFVQVFNAAGAPLTEAISLGDVSGEDRTVADVQVLEGGDFVVLLTGEREDGSEYSTLQRFTEGGTALGPLIPVVEYADDFIASSQIAALDNGGFLVTWYQGLSSTQGRLWGQLRDAQGVVTGPDFKLTDVAMRVMTSANVVALDSGGFAATWMRGPAGGPFVSVVQVFDETGGRVGPEKVFPTEGSASAPQILAHATGFLIVYAGPGTGEYLAQDFTSTGAPQGPAYLLFVNKSDLFQLALTPRLSLLDNGDIVAVWQDAPPSSTFDANGNIVRGGTGEFDFPQDAVISMVILSPQNPVTGNDLANSLNGTAVADRMSGLDGEDTLRGNAGSDVLEGGAGADLLQGGGGVDTASWARATSAVSVSLTSPGTNTGEAAGDRLVSIERLVGSAFADQFEGNAAANHIDGGFGNDSLFGLGGSDTLLGGLGDDVLEGGRGVDLLDGGVGLDAASYARATAGVTVNLRAPSTNAGDALGDHYVMIENVIGSEFGDSVRGSDGRNRLDGNGGGDLLQGDYGDDFLFGGAGNDTLDGGYGRDRLEGGADFDVASYANAGPVSGTGANALGLVVQLGAPSGNTGEAAGDQYFGIEGVVGSSYRDTLTGTATDNLLDGGQGADILRGQGGNDVYLVDHAGDIVDESTTGASGVDEVRASLSFSLANTTRVLGQVEWLTLTGIAAINATGNGDANRITGNDSANVLIGGGGADLMSGGTRQIDGADTFRFLSITDSGITSATRDRISDFGAGDRIDLARLDAVAGTATNDAFRLDVNGDFGAGEIRQIRVNGGVLIEVNTDADAAIEFSLMLLDRTAFLSEEQFIL